MNKSNPMKLEDVMKTGSIKAILMLQGLREISDKEVIRVISDIHFQKEYAQTWAHTMRNIHNVTVEEALLKANSPDTNGLYKFVTNDVSRELNAMSVEFSEIGEYFPGLGRSIIALSMLLQNNIIRADQSKALLKLCMKTENFGKDIEEIICAVDILDEDTSAIDDVIKEIIAANPQIIAEYKSGKEKVLGSLIGQVMKKIKGNPQDITAKIKAML